MPRLKKMFQNQRDIERHITNLQTTLRGLADIRERAIKEQRHDVAEMLLPQVQTLNRLQADLSDDLFYCRHRGFYGERWEHIEEILSEEEKHRQFWTV